MARARFCRESTHLDNARYGWSCAARQHRSVQGFCVLGGPGSPGSQRDNRSQNRSKTSPRSPRIPSSGLTATRIWAIDINRPSLQGEPGDQPVIYRHGMDATPCNANTVWWIMPTTTARSVGGPRTAETTVHGVRRHLPRPPGKTSDHWHGRPATNTAVWRTSSNDDRNICTVNTSDEHYRGQPHTPPPLGAPMPRI